jgi:hypothetical protein
MSNQITPDKIYSKVLNNEIEKKDAAKLFESLIHNSDSEEIRCKALEFLGKIALDDKKTFEIIENCLISDESPRVRFEAAKILILNYPHRESESLMWTLQNENTIYFVKKLFDLFETYDTSQSIEVKEKVQSKIQLHYDLNLDDSRFVLDIDYLDYMKFKTEFENFLHKFDYPHDAQLKLLKENTEMGNKGLGRVQSSKNGYIINLLLKDLIEIPKSICKLSQLEFLEISHCTLKRFPDMCPNLLSLKKLVLKNNKFERLPSWVIQFASKHKYVKKYIAEGVIDSEARVLSILEILTGQPCKKLSDYDQNGLEGLVGYSLNNLGHIVKIKYLSKERKIGVFPEELCELEFLEELSLIDQSISIIPKTIGNLHKLTMLDLSYNKLEYVPESIKKLNNLEHFYLRSQVQNNR